MTGAQIKGFIFDLDGVIVDTAQFHAECWTEMAASIGIGLEQEDLDSLRGVGRMDSLNLILAHGDRDFSESEKIQLAASKNDCYLAKVQEIKPNDILPGVHSFLKNTQALSLSISLGSSSKNAKTVLEKLKITDLFDAICDGTDITKSKPDPQIFLLACERLSLDPTSCVVFEDAAEGINAALRAGCKVVGVGPDGDEHISHAHMTIADFEQITPQMIVEFFNPTK